MTRSVVVLGLVVLVGLMVLSQGCASIMEGSKRTVSITSEPTGAAFTIYNKKGEAIDSGMTPATVTLKPGAGYFSAEKYTVKLTKAGCPDSEASIENGISGWYLVGNIIFGGLIGYLVVDPLTGAMWTLKDLHVDMMSPGSQVQVIGNTLKIVTMDQVPRQLRPMLVRIN